MKLTTLHIISLDVPVPADYGGVIDIYFRAKALKELNVRIILHCFENGRNTDQDFSEIADEVYFYKQKKTLLSFLKSEPFIVTSRTSKKLVKRLLKDKLPILMEGHHCAGILNDSRFNNRKKFVRIHNVEWKYYRAISESHISFWRKIIYSIESEKLRRFDSSFVKADGLFCLNSAEKTYYKSINPSSYLWPVGCCLEKSKELPEQDYILFHGNLKVLENEEALFRIVNIWVKNKLTVPLIIAGKEPNQKLKKLLNIYNFVELIENPNNEEIINLISAAKINLLYTSQSTGVKLKLLNSLIHGKKCIANSLMVEGTDLGQFCDIIDDEQELVSALQKDVMINNQELETRRKYLETHYNVFKNAERLVGIIEKRLEQ